jgi:hypothetical protein
MSEGPSVSVPRPPTVLQVVRLQAAAHSWEGRTRPSSARCHVRGTGSWSDDRGQGRRHAYGVQQPPHRAHRRLLESAGLPRRCHGCGARHEPAVHGPPVTPRPVSPSVRGRPARRTRRRSDRKGPDEPVDNNTILIVDRSTTPWSRVEGGIGARRNVLLPATQSARTSDWSSSGLDQTPVTCDHRSQTP